MARPWSLHIIFLLYLQLTSLIYSLAIPESYCTIQDVAKLMYSSSEFHVPFSLPNTPINLMIENTIPEMTTNFQESCARITNIKEDNKECVEQLITQFKQWIRNTCTAPIYTPNKKDICQEIKNQEVLPPDILSPLTSAILDHILQQREQSNWNNYYKDVVTFINDHYNKNNENENNTISFVEIGTKFGGLSNYIAGEIKNAHVYAVDPFLGGYDDTDRASNDFLQWSANMKLSNEEFSKHWALALSYEQHRRHGCRHHQIHAKSIQGALDFHDQSLDIVFIDGLHTYEGVAMDILAWLRKLKKPGGTIIFNDFDNSFPDVIRAVLDFIITYEVNFIRGEFGLPPGIGNAAAILL